MMKINTHGPALFFYAGNHLVVRLNEFGADDLLGVIFSRFCIGK